MTSERDKAKRTWDRPEIPFGRALQRPGMTISKTEPGTSKFAYKIAIVQCGYVPVISGQWTGRESNDVLTGADPERIEEILKAAGCPTEQQFLGDLGEDGWELIGVVPQSLPELSRMYLKKVVA